MDRVRNCSKILRNEDIKDHNDSFGFCADYQCVRVKTID